MDLRRFVKPGVAISRFVESARSSAAPMLQQVQVRVYTKGPFKGRRYVLNADGSQGRRLRPDATKEDIEKGLRGD